MSKAPLTLVELGKNIQRLAISEKHDRSSGNRGGTCTGRYDQCGWREAAESNWIGFRVCAITLPGLTAWNHAPS